MHSKVAASVAGAVLFALLLTPPTSKQVLKDTFLPPNNMRIEVGSMGTKGISREQYDKVMDRIEEIYGPIIAAQGGKLVVNRLWDDATVNASAERQGDNYVINMYGGLARHQAITQDGMALVACHELGHHLGGAPKVADMNTWASNEGQSDYYAGLKCLRRVFSGPGSESFTRKAADDVVAQEACFKSFLSPMDRKLCLRSSIAGMSVTALLRELSGDTAVPHFDTPDPAVVEQTDDNHPATQCRLDTYFQGSLCARPLTDVLSDLDPTAGTCTRAGGFSVGLRPLCWYKPTPAEAGPSAAAHQSVVKASAILSTLRNPDVWREF